MFGIVDSLAFKVSLQTDSQDLPLGPGHIESLAIIEDCKTTLPVVQLSFKDPSDAVARGALTDGCLVNVLLSPNRPGVRAVEHTFRVFSAPDITNTSLGKKQTLTGYLDKPDYWRKIGQQAYEGTSAEAIRNIAQQHHIERVDTDSTNDQQVWLPINKPVSQFIRYIADRGYRSGSSCMMTALTDFGRGNWTLRYKDVVSQLQHSSGFRFASLGHGSTSDYRIWNYVISNLAGFNNNYLAYNSKTYQQKIEGILRGEDLTEVIKTTINLNMSSVVKGMMDQIGTRRDFYPLETGNTHEKFADAWQQNRRLRTTFSVDVSILTDDYTEIGLLDSADLVLATTKGDEIDRNYSGRYLLTSKTRFVQGNHYREKLVFSSQGSNGEANGGMM